MTYEVCKSCGAGSQIQIPIFDMRLGRCQACADLPNWAATPAQTVQLQIDAYLQRERILRMARRLLGAA